MNCININAFMVRGSGFRVSGSQLTMIADAEKIRRILWKGSGRQVFFPSFALSMFVTLLIFSVRIVKYLISWILIKFFNTKNNFSWRHKLAIQRLQIDIVKGRTYYICHIHSKISVLTFSQIKIQLVML